MCTCVSYLHSLLTSIRKPMQHRSSGCVLHFTPTVNTNMENRYFFCDCITRWNIWYAGIAVPQVLQYLREFDAPAMQSCKPLPCGIGSCQNRRLREQTLNRKPCHCGSIKGGWCMELPTSLDQPLQGQIVCACLDMFLPV